MKLSLIIATYNRGAKIGATLDSVLAQTRVPSEIVVVDDGSSDSTGEWVRSNYPGVRVLSTPNGGTSLARNRGAEAASGDILVFLDHDDTLLPHAVETLAGLLEKFPEAHAAHADHRYVNLVSGQTYENHHSSQSAFARLAAISVLRRDGDARLYGRDMHRALLKGNLLQQPWAIRRSTFLSLGGFEPSVRYCEDWDLYLRVAAAVPLVLSDQVISNHVVEGENLHLAPGQEVMYRRVIRRQLRAHFPWRPAAIAVLLRRLAMYHKMSGDQAFRDGERGRSWGLYLRSALAWPLDHVVLVRLLLRAPGACLATLMGSGVRGRGGYADVP